MDTFTDLNTTIESLPLLIRIVISCLPVIFLSGKIFGGYNEHRTLTNNFNLGGFLFPTYTILAIICIGLWGIPRDWIWIVYIIMLWFIPSTFVAIDRWKVNKMRKESDPDGWEKTASDIEVNAWKYYIVVFYPLVLFFIIFIDSIITQLITKLVFILFICITNYVAMVLYRLLYPWQ